MAGIKPLGRLSAARTKPPVLVAYTNDAAGTAVLHAAAQEAALRQTSIIIVHHLDGPEAPEVFGSQSDSDATRGRVEQRILATARRIAPIAKIDVEVIADSIVSHLVIASPTAELIVAGATFAHAATAALVEALPHELAKRVNCPVLLVPAAASGCAISQVVCGIDRSPGSIDALRWAANEADLRGTTLLAVEVASRHRQHQSFTSDADSLTTWVRQHMPRSATTVLCVEGEGAAAQVLLNTTAEHNGLLVIGAHQRRGGHWRRSVARVVMSQTRVPVVVVPTRTSVDGRMRLSAASPTFGNPLRVGT
jgi:nucleotide-binding universal stress UspA family protein